VAFLGLGAIGGGGALIISPSGDLLKMPVSLLEKSLFNNFLVPGIILFAILGFVPIMLIITLIKRTECKLAEKFNFFDDIHLQKIDLADEIFVINKGGYIGSSTRNEIEYARKVGKPVLFPVAPHS
jgi:hypothetical protein